MSLEFYYHPLASFCHKVLIALYENETPFDAYIVDLMDTTKKKEFLELWPVGKIPVLRDIKRGKILPETSIIIEYLDKHYPGSQQLLPLNDEKQLKTRLWDRFYDQYVQVPMQKIVINTIRDESERDPCAERDAAQTLTTAYGMIEKTMSEHFWAAGDDFTMADCAAAPALFYAGIVCPFPEDHQHLNDYFERLVARPSIARVLREAQPYFEMFPLKDRMPERFLNFA